MPVTTIGPAATAGRNRCYLPPAQSTLHAHQGRFVTLKCPVSATRFPRTQEPDASQTPPQQSQPDLADAQHLQLRSPSNGFILSSPFPPPEGRGGQERARHGHLLRCRRIFRPARAGRVAVRGLAAMHESVDLVGVLFLVSLLCQRYPRSVQRVGLLNCMSLRCKDMDCQIEQQEESERRKRNDWSSYMYRFLLISSRKCQLRRVVGPIEQRSFLVLIAETLVEAAGEENGEQLRGRERGD